MGIRDSLALVLAGGAGTRLAPLTADRAKPAVPFGGKYRIIDFTLANCLHSGVRRIMVLTQYKSHSLQKHLRDGWSIFNPELGEFITTIPPQMRGTYSWYLGTADSVYQNLSLIERNEAEAILILSGDHIYRMDYAAMLKQHQEAEADVTIACMEVGVQQASGFGVMEVDHDHRVIGFEEKPESPATLPYNRNVSLASMGIYIFSREKLFEILNADHEEPNSSHDFGKDIMPRIHANHRVFAYMFGTDHGRVSPDGYWRDVGTIDAYYQANMDLLEPVPSMNLYQDDWYIRTYMQQTPPARNVSGESGTEGIFINSSVAGGTIIAGGSVNHSILFSKVFIDDEAFVEDSILFSGVRAGRKVKLRNCIVDKHVRIPDGETIGFNEELDRSRFTISEDGIVVVPKSYRFTS